MDILGINHALSRIAVALEVLAGLPSPSPGVEIGNDSDTSINIVTPEALYDAEILADIIGSEPPE